MGRYDAAKRMIFIAAFKRAAQVMIEQALTLDSLESELTRVKHEARQDHDQREKKLRLAESQARLFREEADKSSATVEHLRSQVSSLLAERQGWSRNDAGIILLDDHEQIVQRLQEESRKRIDSVEAEKGHIAFQLSRVRLQLAQSQNQPAVKDYREDLLEILAEKLKTALAKDEEQSTKYIISPCYTKLIIYQGYIHFQEMESVRRKCGLWILSRLTRYPFRLWLSRRTTWQYVGNI